MIRVAAAFALAGFLLAASGLAVAQIGLVPLSVTIPFDKTQTYQIAGATAAYPIDGTIVEASAQNGTVQIHAVGAGKTTVIVIVPGGTTTIAVSVPVPPVSVSLGAGEGPGGSAPVIEGGSYLGTYSSSDGQVTNAFEFRRQQGDSFRALTLVNATYVSPTSGSPAGTGFPLISYEVAGPGHDVVYLDQAVTVSPLTFEDALIRGIHIQTGPWVFHAGVSTIAQFGNYFIPTDAQWTAGLSRRFTLSKTASISANLYDIVNSPGAEVTTPGGIVGSVSFAWQPRPALAAYAEVGLSRSIGFSAGLNYDNPTTHFAASFLDKPANFASLAVDAQQGLFGSIDYNKTFSDRFNLTANIERADYNLPVFREDSQTGQATANYALSKTVSVNAGALYTNFVSYYPTSFNVKTLAIPLGVTYATKHFNAGLQWQPTTDFSGTATNGYGANAGIAYGPVAASAFYNHSVDIPTVSSIFSEVPGLQAALEAAGINVNDPAQLAALLSNAALLAKLGFSGLKLDLAPAQNNTGFNASWSGRGRTQQQLTFSYLNSASELTQGSFGFRMATLSYVRRLGPADEMTASATYLRSSETSGTLTSVSTTPSFGLTFRHRFTSVPEFLFPTRHGDIGGYVFHDDEQSGRFSSGDAGIAGVEVTLDGGRTAMTDAQGHYEFSNVPYGTHRVEAQMPGGKPYSFTTDSPATAQIGSTVDFGVSYAASKLFGSVQSDAGTGIGGVVVQLSGSGKSATTRDDGTFTIDGATPGKYTLAISSDSLPAGYDLATLMPANVEVSATAPAPITMSVRALRSISGTVTAYDPRRGTVTPAAGMPVTIPELNLTEVTDSNGAYTFRELPAGTFTVEVKDGGPTEQKKVTLPADPTTQTGIDFRVTAEQRQKAAHLP